MATKRLVIDTTVFEANRSLNSSQFQELKNNVAQERVKVAIPEVVVDEFSNKIGVHVRKAAEDVNRSLHELKTYTSKEQREAFSSDKITEMVKSQVESFKKSLKEEFNAEILAYPDHVNHADLAKKAILHKKPFTNSDKKDCYRDALIWENVKKLLKDDKDDVILITDNIRDFAEGETEQLAKDLVEELRELGIDPERITLVRNLKAFHERFLRDTVQIVDLVQEQSVSGSSVTATHFVQEDYFSNLSPNVLSFALKNFDFSIVLKSGQFFNRINNITRLIPLEAEKKLGSDQILFVLEMDLEAEIGNFDEKTKTLEEELFTEEMTVLAYALFNNKTAELISLDVFSVIK